MNTGKIDQIEKSGNIKKFVETWTSRGNEKSDSQVFWLSFLRDVLGVAEPETKIEFEKPVKYLGSHTGFIDAYLPDTKVLIEQKSIDIDLLAAAEQSDGLKLNPFQQAMNYVPKLPVDQHPKYIITCNFKSFLVYDTNRPNEKPQEILLENLEKEWSRLQFLVHEESNVLQKELEVSIKAGELVGKIYDAFYAEFAKVRGDGTAPGALTHEDLHSLNVLCVRLVFCLYAEDAGIFNKDQFYHYMKSFRPENMRVGLKDLFKILDTKIGDRDPFLEEKYKAFPYVNGNLFMEQPGEVIPTITEETANILLDKASLGFDWSEISPTIFGAVFESTLNPETRRKGGMHYTSIENIHKVIDQLFLDARKTELAEIKKVKNAKDRNAKLQEFRKELGDETFFDPACGSGNFLTETYISLRSLENEALAEQHNGEAVLDVMGDEIFVNIHQFYGIEINDFAATVAKTALWIAESQMMQKTAEILHRNLEFLPLKSYGNITVGNALQIDWSSLCGGDCSFNYIIGNPPFVGYSLQSEEQKNDILNIYVDEKGKSYKTAGKIDFVSGWFFKAAQYMSDHPATKTALVATNSITQGEQVSGVWKPLYERFEIQIDFAYRTFRWDSESNSKAHVHCVIIGFSSTLRHPESSFQCHPERSVSEVEESSNSKKIFINDHDFVEAKNINAYLVDGPNVFVDSRSKPLCDIPVMTTGNRPADGGHLIIEAEEYDAFVKKEPKAKNFIKNLLGSEEFINNKKRYCLWLKGTSPAELRSMPEVMKRVELCKQDRLNSPDKGRQKLADTPHLFRETQNPKTFMIVPAVSSEKRKYVPMGFLTDESIATNLVTIIPEATLCHFGVLTSSVHMAWMRAVCGRLEMRYRYSKDVVYNNFPWPCLDESEKIEKTAQAILDARALYPDSSLADLYDETTMPIELRKAHQANDAAVMAVYGFDKHMTESEIVAKLLEMYQNLVKISN